ncbi:MAG: mannose-1-phosphate guanylyltransferase [Clostridia bacterium]|nr:mannose-1-phosphate guanylyltransferase [Clostridia bacterium]
MNHYGVIMAGGSGTRFWPLSREASPKQLLNLSGNGLLVNEAVDRMATVIGKSNIFVVTSDVQAASMLTATAGRVFPRNILAEPAARNTAACIGYAAMEIVRKYGDGVMIITPSDHYIENVPVLTDVFRTALLTAEREDRLITIGLKPTFPSTGFGYIRFDPNGSGEVRQAIAFREKPDEETARAYVESGEYCWNSGMFIWKAGLILEKLRRHAPDIWRDLCAIGDAMNTPEEQEVLHEVYPRIRAISVDYAVMEPSAAEGDVLLIPADCGWNDVGSWDMMSVLHREDEHHNVLLGDVETLDTSDCVVYAGSRTVTALGVDSLVIVETPDAVLVCRKDRAQDMKQLVDLLRRKGRSDLL